MLSPFSDFLSECGLAAGMMTKSGWQRDGHRRKSTNGKKKRERSIKRKEKERKKDNGPNGKGSTCRRQTHCNHWLWLKRVHQMLEATQRQKLPQKIAEKQSSHGTSVLLENEFSV